ncbi:MAG: asparagine synthase (glutamine-hydrolyzing) [Phycisphaerae bacterium]|nr:asparagine synthase (glutamine-hydrolyzing) [Phycisphaerae bacterium]
MFGPGRANGDLARAMADRLSHHGLDEPELFRSPDGRCAIGFVRQATMVPAGSAQPMSTPDGQQTIAFNGAIYNYRSLRETLAGEGATFRTADAAEVLLELYRYRGKEMASAAEGMFAFAVYDATKGCLLLGRDRLGQKPLWYMLLDDRIVFASEIKALLHHPKASRQSAWPAVTSYLATGYAGSGSAFAGVQKLPPAATMLITSAGAASPENYWQPIWETAQARELIGNESPARLVAERLTYAVESQMLSDVPLGVLLSGGGNSAIIAALMCKIAGDGSAVKTFTAGFEGCRHDERAAARKVAGHLGTDHTELLIKPDPAGMLDWVVGQYDEPFADSTALPTFLLCKAVREHVEVVLTGNGGDEVFGGYARYRTMYLADTLSPFRYLAVRLAAALARPFAPNHERNRLRRLIRFADGLTDPPAIQYFRYRRLFGPDELARLLTREFLDGIDSKGIPPEQVPRERFCRLYEQCDLPDEAAFAQRHDLLSYLPDDLLVKADIASTAASLELRAPMLDHRLVDIGLSIPAEKKINSRKGRLILAEAFGHLLPPEVFTLPSRGFDVPLASWLRNELRDEMLETLTDPALLRMGIFREEALAGLMNDHLSGKYDFHRQLWTLMVLARWLAKTGTGNR